MSKRCFTLFIVTEYKKLWKNVFQINHCQNPNKSFHVVPQVPLFPIHHHCCSNHPSPAKIVKKLQDFQTQNPFFSWNIYIFCRSVRHIFWLSSAPFYICKFCIYIVLPWVQEWYICILCTPHYRCKKSASFLAMYNTHQRYLAIVLWIFHTHLFPTQTDSLIGLIYCKMLYLVKMTKNRVKHLLDMF